MSSPARRKELRAERALRDEEEARRQRQRRLRALWEKIESAAGGSSEDLQEILELFAEKLELDLYGQVSRLDDAT